MSKRLIRLQPARSSRLIAMTLILAAAAITYIKPEGAGAEGAAQPQASTETLSEQDRIEVFEKVWKAVNDKYYDSSFNGVNWNGAREQYRPLVGGMKTDEEFYTLLNRMLGDLHDAHTFLRTPRGVEASKRRQTISGGVVLREIEGLPVVFSVEADSDAARAGIAPGMIVRTVDGEAVGTRFAVVEREAIGSSSERLTRLRIYARLLAGPPDTTAKLGLERADGSLLEAARGLKRVEIHLLPDAFRLCISEIRRFPRRARKRAKTRARKVQGRTCPDH